MSIHNRGQHVPVVAFYSVQGGVGKSTLARKFAELVTVAPGREGRKPNVLLVDLDVEAQGLTFRLAQGLRQNFRTVHEVFAERNVAVAQAITVTGAVSLASGNPLNRGQLYLMPAAPPQAVGLFDTIANIEKTELLRLLADMIKGLVMQYDISCVVIDCAPGANPYTAAAATLASVPFLVGRNEPTTYEQIRVLPERFREWYDQFQPAKQRVIINAVTVKDLYESRAQQYSVFDYIPLTSDVIHETEGLPRTGSLRMLLFEKYIVDIIRQVFVGMNHLIPEAPEVVGKEWMEVLSKLEHCEEAPRVRRLHRLSYLRWAGIALVVVGIALVGLYQVFDHLPAALTNLGIGTVIAGVILGACGWYAESERQRILNTAQKLIMNGPDGVFQKLKEGASHRRELDEMQKLADTIPDHTKLLQSEPN
jgi:cellulose biosynthesis protein BcsQ